MMVIMIFLYMDTMIFKLFKIKIKKIFGLFVLGSFAVGLLFFSLNNVWGQEQEFKDNFLSASDSNLEGAQWLMFDRFDGYQTKADPTKITAGANPQGQNTIINDGDRVSVRDFGYEILGAATTTQDAITTLYNFRKRSGENILIRTRGTYVEYFEEGNNTWETVTSTYTNGYNYGFAAFNINTDQISYVYFGNSQDDFSRWTGAHTLTNGALALNDSFVTVNDTTDGFSTTGTIAVCGALLNYSSKTNTQFNLSASSTVACEDNRGVTQAIDTFPSYPKGNIYLVSNNRLFISGVTSTPQAVYFSKYGDANTWLDTLVSDGTADAAGVFNLTEGGGEVVAAAQDEGAIYFFKRSIIYKATLDDTLYTLQPLKPFDGKSQTTGATNNKSTFTGGNGIYFITPDRQIMNLTRVENFDYPQIWPISDIVKPTVNQGVFNSAVGIFWQDKAYIAFKTDENSTINDVVFIENYRKTVTTERPTWESPVIGWNVSDFVIYDDGESEELYFGDAVTANVYKVIEESVDDNLGITANWRSKQFDFGTPHSLKEMDNLYIEGYILPNTNLTISLLLDEDGDTQTYTTEFSGTETNYLFDAQQFNLFGFHPFGFERFGSSKETGFEKFRIYLSGKMRRVPFYTAQIEFASDGIGQNWEIIKYGFHVRPYTQPIKRSLIRDFQ